MSIYLILFFYGNIFYKTINIFNTSKCRLVSYINQEILLPK